LRIKKKSGQSTGEKECRLAQPALPPLVKITFELPMRNFFEEIYFFLRLEIIIEINKKFIIL